MGCLSFTWSLTKIFLACVILTFIPGIPPHADYKAYNVVRPKSLVADLLTKRHLDNAERVFEGQITGPEAFAVHNGAIYTGIHGGFVVQIDEGELRPVVKFGQNCDDITEEEICGRPLGLQFDQAGNLYVADAYYGIYKYNIAKGQKTLLVSVDEEINGKKALFINGLDVAKDGTVYFTVSSTSFKLNEGLHAILSAGDGRVMKYDPHTKVTSVLADGLLCPNGIALSANQDFLVFSEIVAARLMRLDLKGSNKGTVSVFAEGLPGLPDNIRFDGRDGFFVAMVVPADESHPAIPVSLGPFPYIRKFLARALYLLELPFVQINNIYPNYFCRRVAHSIGHLSTTAPLSPEGVTILHIDSHGDIKDALVGKDGSVNHVSDMIVAGDYILLASPYNNYIGRVPRPDAPHQVHIKSVRFQDAAAEKKDDAISRKAAEEAKAKQAKKAAEEAAKKAAEEAAARARKATEEATKKAAEKAARQKKEAEAAAAKSAEELKARLAAEEAKKRAAEEVKAKKAAQDAARAAAEEAKARKAAEEAKARKAAEEGARRAAEEAKARKAAEEGARRAAEEAKAKKLAEEAKAQKLADEARAKKSAEELKLKKAAEESAKRKATEEAKANRATEF